MTEIFVFSTASLTKKDYDRFAGALLKTPLSLDVAEVLSRKNEQARLDAVAARALLLFAYRKAFGQEVEPLLKNELGAPYFASGIRVSISHTEGAVALLLSDDFSHAYGVDIESASALARASRVNERFFGDFCPTSDGGDAVLYLASPSGTDPLEFDFVLSAWDAPCEPSLASFTCAEAVLKSTGLGFGALSDFKKISQECEIGAFGFSLVGKPFVLSFARRTPSRNG